MRTTVRQGGIRVLALVLALAAAAQSASDGSENRGWQALAPMPVGNAGFAHGVVAGRLVVAGGTTWRDGKKTVLDAVWRYDPARNVWELAGRLPRPFAFGGFASDGHRLWLAGGDDGETTHRDVLCWPAASAAQPSLQLPLPLAYAGSACADDTLYLVGGTQDVRKLDRLGASVFAVALDTGAVRRLPDYPGGPVLHAAAVTLDGDLIVLPGGTYDVAGRRALNGRTAWRLSIATGKWERLADYPVSVRGLGVGAYEGHVLAFGGYVGGSPPSASFYETNAGFLFDVARNAYRALPALPYSAMLMGVERIGSQIYVFGGEDRDRHRATDMYRASIPELIEASRATSGAGAP